MGMSRTNAPTMDAGHTTDAIRAMASLAIATVPASMDTGLAVRQSARNLIVAELKNEI